MFMKSCWARVALAVVSFAACGSSFAQMLTVVSVDPPRHLLTAPIATPISITFDRAVQPSSVTAQSFRVYGRWTGAATGAYTFSNGNKTVTLTPTRVFQSGDVVTVTLSHDLVAADASPMRQAGYSYQFWTRTRPAAMNFVEIDEFSNRIANGQTRIYGAMAADLNSDGYPDLATVNEVSSDVRVFLNAADNTGLFEPMLTPPFPISFEASPNESGDFNGDGIVDMCIAASGTSTMWVLLGNGDGTWAPPGQELAVGNSPHGITVLDVDGDGDMDIVTANTGGDDLSLLLNNGSGVFGAATSIESGCDGEYGLGSGDFDNDGILDLVAGCRFTENAVVLHGNGNGTFTSLTPEDANGLVWMIALGDVNADGNLDVTTANSHTNNGSVLIGNGSGGLSFFSSSPISGHAVATDLGDIDGDGDLDWLLSSFGGSVWYLYRNNGSGIYTFNQQFSANNNPSCAILLDFDGDRDLDLALTDEIADVIQLKQNSGIAKLYDFDGDTDVDGTDYTQFASCFGGSGVAYGAGCFAGDFNGDGDVDCEDWSGFQDAWTAGGEIPELPQCAVAETPAMSATAVIAMALVLTLAASFVLLGAKKRTKTT